MGYHPNCRKCGKEMVVYEDETGCEIYGVDYCRDCKIILY